MGRPLGPVTCSDTLIRAGDPEAPRLAGLASLTAMGANVIEAIRGAPGEPVGCAASWSLELLDCAATGRPPAQAASTTSRMAIAPAPRVPHSFTSRTVQQSSPAGAAWAGRLAACGGSVRSGPPPGGSASRRAGDQSGPALLHVRVGRRLPAVEGDS